MQIRVGFEMEYQCPAPTPMMLAVNIHHSRASDLLRPDHLTTDPPVPVNAYRDSFGNWCSRLVAPPGRFVLRNDALVRDSGQFEPSGLFANEVPVEQLPESTLQFLLGSRYCETDLLSNTAWQLFGNGPRGWARVQAVCDYVHRHIQFGYQHARNTRTASEAFNEGRGVCRDYAHLAVTLCRALNIPARYCTGYIGDMGLPPNSAPMDFAAWFEAYLDGGWYTFDPRNNAPRIGRILMARGRDACDVAIANTFGANTLQSFKVWCDDVPGVV